jgi:tetratricopeptide (TPR) repeat protein
MASTQMRMLLAVRQVDSDLRGAAARYPGSLPPTHPDRLRAWNFPLKWADGLLVRYTREEWEKLGLAERATEVARSRAEAELVRARAGEVSLDDDERRLLTERALGIQPAGEAERFAELQLTPEWTPRYMTSSPERFAAGVDGIRQEYGQATALGYGYVLMAGVRSAEDLAKYGSRLQELFETIVAKPAVAQVLVAAGRSGMAGVPHEARARLVKSVRETLWSFNTNRAGRSFLLTQVVDGYLGLKPGGVGDDLGLSVVDGIFISKLTLPVHFLAIRGGVFLEIGLSTRGVECWDPFDRNAEVRTASARRLELVEVLAQGYLRMARGYANLKSFQHGARVAQWVLGLQPNSAEAYQILGQCQLGEQRPREALETCERALELDRRLADAYLVQGNAYSLLSQWPEAIERYRQAIQHRVGYAEAYNNLGLVLSRNGEHARAVGAYHEAVRVRPDYAEAYYNLGNLHFEVGQGLEGEAADAELGRAVRAYEMAVKVAPDFAGAHYNLGQTHYAMKNLPAALAAYQAAVKANPKHAGAWHNMGIVYRDLGRNDDAVAALEKAVTLNPILLR